MIKVFITGAVVSHGFNGAPALRFSDNGDIVRFRIGHKVYDTRAENNTRWLNYSVKAFGAVCERIKKMQLKDGSYICFSGRLDEESWQDQTTGETKTQPVIILEDIEYAFSGGSKEKQMDRTNPTHTADPAAGETGAEVPSSNFTGFEPFDGEAFY